MCDSEVGGRCLGFGLAACTADRPLACFWFHPGQRLPLDVFGLKGVALALEHRALANGILSGAALSII